MLNKLKFLLPALLISFSLFLANQVLAATAYFSPAQGEQAFEKIYQMVDQAKKEVHLTIYSWSDATLKNKLELAAKRGVKVRAVLHPSLASRANIKNWVKELELAGATFKTVTMNMHEKFVVVDKQFAVNSSANMSTGAKTRYSENWVFLDALTSSAEKKLVQSFVHEFAILFNSAKDIFTHKEDPSVELKDYQFVQASNPTNLPLINDSSRFLSSSMNWSFFKVNDQNNLNQGVFLRRERNIDGNDQTWIIKKSILHYINHAKQSVYLNIAFFNLEPIKDALINAIKRGVEVKLVVDNQEYRSRANGREMTPYFVRDYRKMLNNNNAEPPVRVKFYSLSPSPRYWRLNHHKYLVIDHQTINPVLITGSYNLSKNAEHNQFDNMVIFDGAEFRNLVDSFVGEFNQLWSLNRTRQDKPKREILAPMTEASDSGRHRIHLNDEISLSWNEIESLRDELNRKAPGILAIPFKRRDCLFFNPANRTFDGC
jgi:phosphatidylserine/phosphatidylglycerophosphate/cardiolipin synthase-like enzyme